ncbi:MAG: hypothetical protein ACKV2Q_18020 [Planctomycetaceae bacterium]
MTESEQFAAADALLGNTMIVFSDRAIADRYIVHRSCLGQRGIFALVEDTRERTGLCVVWRAPIPKEQFLERLANYRWLLEETLAGRSPWPNSGFFDYLGNVGGQNGSNFREE